MLKYSKDGKCSFDPVTHTYRVNGELRTGVTSHLKKYCTPFDREGESKKYARKHGLTQEAVLEAWDEKGRISREDGTRIHAIFERFILTGSIETGSSRKDYQAAKFIRENFLSKKVIPFDPEVIVYNRHLATQLDCPTRRDGKVFLLDFKTNEKIKTDSFKGAMMLPPFQHLPDCSFSHYSLQMNYCERLYQNTYGEKVAGSFIVHIKETGYEVLPVEKIDIPNECL